MLFCPRVILHDTRGALGTSNPRRAVAYHPLLRHAFCYVAAQFNLLNCEVIAQSLSPLQGKINRQAFGVLQEAQWLWGSGSGFDLDNPMALAIKDNLTTRSVDAAASVPFSAV